MSTKQQRVMLARSIDQNLRRVEMALVAVQEAQAHDAASFARECKALAIAATHLSSKAAVMRALEEL